MAKICFVMVGLPARGKSYIAKLITRYLSWLGVQCKVFNVGEYRRTILGAGQKNEFWDPNNQDAFQQRQKMSLTALQDMIDYFKEGGQVAIFDATNTTRERRKLIIDTMLKDKELAMTTKRVIFVESICNDKKIIDANIRDIKIKSSDYNNVDAEQAFKDFLGRIKQYEAVYQPLDDNHDCDLSYIKLIDVGKKIILNNIQGYIPGRITSLLMNVHILPTKIYLCRHGESEYNVLDKVGGDSGLSAKGRCYPPVLAQFIKQQSPKNLIVWTSTLKRAAQTTETLEYPVIQFKALDEIDVGIFDGMTYKEIEEKQPADYERRKQDKYRYRYPRGESYEDLVNRLEPVIIELERQRTPILIVAHQAVTRVLYAYLTGQKPETCTEIPIPLHTVIEITPTAYGHTEKRYDLNAYVEEEYAKLNKN
jgi:broad specificity phosphatase PhoE/predicted kinase